MGCSSPRPVPASTLIETGNASLGAERTPGGRQKGTEATRQARRIRRAFMPWPPWSGASEVELHAELKLPRRAERAGHPACGRGVDRGGRRIEARCVREVEALHAQLELFPEALEDREVEV